MNGFRDSFSPFEPLEHYPNADTIDFPRPLSRTNSPFPGHFTTAPVATAAAVASNTSSAEVDADHNVLTCRQCGQMFTGTYRSGNCRRHIQNKHTGADSNVYKCGAPGCFKIYQRQDARLKHMRSRHPELHVPPVQRRRAEASSTQTLSRVRANSSPNQQSLQPADKEHVDISASDEYLHVPSAHTGTRPSTPSYERSFSQHPRSTFTDSYDSSFLSPHSSYPRRPTSLPASVFEDRSLSPLPSPGRALSQCYFETCVDTFIDLALLNSTGIDSEDDPIYGEHTPEYFSYHAPY
jgi:hypothetical protein